MITFSWREVRLRRLYPFLAGLFLLAGAASWADTYDGHALAAITASSPEQVKLLYDLHVDITGRKGDIFKALLTNDQLCDLQEKGLRVDLLQSEMDEDRRLWREADDASKALAAASYYTASKFNTVNPPAGSLMEHLLQLYNAHPGVCRLYNLGASQDGNYNVIAMKVSKNPDVVEAEPKIRIYGNIHGDEKIGCMVACDVLDTILAGYAANPQDATAKKLVDESEMWFIPMGNPWGNANNSRYNSRNVDLNRNFWGPAGSGDGYPSAAPWTEKETQAIRDLTEAATADHSKKRFAVSISFHSGDECFNSIWNYTTAAPLDEPVFWASRTPGTGCSDQNGCLTLAPHGLAQAYKDGCTQPGFWFTEGGDWYVTNGDTNDWAYGEWSDLDTTVELDSIKTPSTSQIATDCAYHRQAVLNYMLKAFQGIHGVMTDVASGAPMDGKVAVTATASPAVAVPHDYPAIYTDPVAGDFHRVLQPGTYTVTCTASGYAPTVVAGVTVSPDAKTVCNCPMSTTKLAYSSSTMADVCSGTGSGGDGVLDPGESAILQVTLANTGPAGATNVSAWLSASTPGITVTQATAAFPSVAGNGTASSYAPHFQFHVDTGVACGTVISFSLHAACDQGAWDSSFTVTVGSVSPGGTATAYSEPFSTVSPPSLPSGWTTLVASGAAWATNASGCSGNGLRYPGNSAAADSWAFTPAIHLTAGVTYTLAFNQKVGGASYPQKLTVTAGTSAAPSSQTISIYSNTNLTNTACAARNGSFTVPGTGTYYLGFQCTSAGGSGSNRTLTVDDVALTYVAQPTCTSHACAPVAPPGEVAPGGSLAASQQWSSKTTMEWPALSEANGYNLYRGSLAELPNLTSGGTDSCLRQSGSATTATLSENPSAAGGLYWYIVTGVNGGGEGTAGDATSGPRQVTSGGLCQ